MALSKLTIFCLLAALSYVAAENSKFELIRREALLAASQVRSIIIATPEDKVQLFSIANDFIADLNQATYIANFIVLNLAGNEAYGTMVEVAELFGNLSNNIQNAFSGKAEELKEVLATSLEDLNRLVVKYKDFKTWNQFLITQLQREHDFIIFAIYKARYQAIYFKKTNKEIMDELVTSGKLFAKGLKEILHSGDAARIELAHAMQHLSDLGSKDIYTLQNWIQLNSNDAKNVKIVQKVANTLSELCLKLSQALVGNQKAPHLKKELMEVYHTGVEVVQTLADVDYSGRSGGEEFLRGTLIDSVVVEKSFIENIKGSLLTS